MYISNPIVYLFDELEKVSGIELATFTTSEKEDKSSNNDQPYMKQYQDQNESSSAPQLYKYIYDPSLEFSYRFHQRIASVKYSDRNKPWVSIMFNTGQVRPLTNVVSHKYNTLTTFPDGFYELSTRRVSVPIKMVFISNDISYLYTFLENISFYWDRICNYPYKQAIQYEIDYTENYDQVGQALNITPMDLEKLDTDKRGSLVTAGYSFDLVYYQHAFKNNKDYGHILKTIDLRIITVPDLENLNIYVQ